MSRDVGRTRNQTPASVCVDDTRKRLLDTRQSECITAFMRCPGTPYCSRAIRPYRRLSRQTGRGGAGSLPTQSQHSEKYHMTMNFCRIDPVLNGTYVYVRTGTCRWTNRQLSGTPGRLRLSGTQVRSPRRSLLRKVRGRAACTGRCAREGGNSQGHTGGKALTAARLRRTAPADAGLRAALSGSWRG